MAKVSIIIPTHNRAAMLSRAVESAKLAGAEVEVVVVDDASTDETREVCQSLKDIRYLRLESNVRQAAARNAGLSVCSGEYVAFLDDDDLRLPGSLDLQAQALDRDASAAFVYGSILFGDPVTCEPTGETAPLEFPSGDIFWKLLEGNFIYLPSVLARRQLVEEVGRFDPAVTGVEDWDLWIRLAERHNVVAVAEPMGIYRNFDSQSGQTSSNRAMMCAVSARAQAKGLLLPRALEAPVEKRRKIRQRFLDVLSEMLVNEAVVALTGKNRSRALKNYLAALRFNPQRAAHPHTLKLLWSSRSS